jgi:hypothetical protein
MHSVLRKVLICISCATLAERAAAQASPNVAPDERVYRDIDRLTAAGLIDRVIVGSRPYSRREIHRLLTEAQRNLNRLSDAHAWAEQTIARDVQLYAEHPNRVMDAARDEASWIDSPPRVAPSDANGFIRANIDPLVANRGGRPIYDGTITNTLETFHSATIGPWLAVAVNPRLTADTRGRNRPIGDSSVFALQTGSVNALFGNLSIEVGRDYTLFGQAPTGGLLLSEDAPALDMIRISNDMPAELPWLFRYLGPMRGVAFVADMGHDAFHPHARLIGYHLSARPHPRLEVGIEVTDALGGGGAPSFSVGQALVDAFPFINPILRHRSDFVSNKFFGGDIRWRVPGITGVELYGEGAVDDFDARRFRSSLFEDGGYIFGAHAACVIECGRLGVRAEFHQTGIRYYTHGDYDMTSRNWILGDPLGPRALGGYLTLDSDFGRIGEFSLTAAHEVRNGNTYGSAVTGVDTRGFHFVLDARRPFEQRSRALASWIGGPHNQHLDIKWTAGVERVTNFDFVDGQTRTNGLFQVSLEFRP